MHIKHLATACTLACLAMTTAHAADGFKPVLGVSVTGGGDTLATVSYTNGDSQNVKSGGLLHLFGGVEFKTGAFALQANVGYHVDDTNAKNGSVKFSRNPIELLGFWHAADSFRLGLGARKAGSAKLSSSGAAASIGSLKLESKAGAIVQGEYLYNGGNGSVFLRYVSEKYTVGTGSSKASVSGNHVGLGVSYRFF
jgi:opacity protein-like surface antigen